MTEIEADISTDKQVKSKKRVTDHGEVFTAEREVNAMLDLVKQETERIDARFLEPACGTGNFLVAILERKLQIVTDRYAKSQLEFERYAVTAVSSMYGVDILQDNVAECRKRLFDFFDAKYTALYKNEAQDACKNTILFILNRNILWGDALSLKTPDEKAEPIVFSEWSFVTGSMIKRRDYTLANLLQGDVKTYNAKVAKKTPKQISAFTNEEDPAFLPTPVAEFPLVHFLTIADNHEEHQL
jgi:SAM-dependent methyltransferase